MNDLVLFVAFPYLAVALAVMGGAHRYYSHRFSYSSQSSQFLENRLEFWGAVPWHYGILIILAAHLLALLFPGAWARLIAAPVRLYLLEVTGLALAVITLLGLALLIVRRLINSRVLAVTSAMDWILLVTLLAQVTMGLWVALFYRWGSEWYLHTAVPWIVSLAVLDPKIEYVTALPWIVKLHLLGGFMIIALFPFTRLVHLISVPLGYLWRPYQVVIWNSRRRRLIPGAPARGHAEEAGSGPYGAVHGSKRQALALATMGFFGGFAGVAIFGPLVPRFKDLMHLSPLQAGILAATANLTGSLLRIPFGASVDKVGGRRPFLILLGLTTIGIGGILLLLRTHYPDRMMGLYPVLLVLAMLAGCGIATFSVGIGQVSYWFPRKEQGGALGVFAGLGNTAPGLFSWLLPVAVVSFGMFTAYSFWLALLVAITLIYALTVYDAPSFQLHRQGWEIEPAELAALGQELTPRPAAASMDIATHQGVTWVLTSFYFTSFGGFLALTVWLPSYWHNMYNLSLVRAGLLTLIFAEIASLVRVPGGLLADRVSIKYALTGNFALIAAGAAMVAFSNDFALSFVGTLAIGLGMGLQNAIVFKLLPRYIPQAVGSAAGLVGGLGAFGGFFIPPVMGAIVEIVGAPLGYARGFLFFDLLVAFNLVLVLWLARWRVGVKDAMPRAAAPSPA